MNIPEQHLGFWQAFAATQPTDPGPRFLEACFFDDSEPSANELAQLVLAGRKRATAGLLWTHEVLGTRVPAPGDLSIVTDFAGQAMCIIETRQVDIVPFEAVDAAFAAAEGEGDGSLAYWQRAHQAFFERECARIGRSPHPSMPVVCEHFDVIYPTRPGGSMKLIGMLDSPYVRRVAISLQLLGLRFEHQSLSVFRGFAEFQKINPVVKAPTLLCADGTVLMDSTLILEYAEALARPHTLMPADVPTLQRDLHLLGLALAATEKSVQIVYEHGVRPPEKLHDPWLQRVTGQMRAAWDVLEHELARLPAGWAGTPMCQAGVTLAVAWQFARQTIPALLPADAWPRLAAFSAEAEATPAFRAAPHGEGTYQAPA